MKTRNLAFAATLLMVILGLTVISAFAQRGSVRAGSKETRVKSEARERKERELARKYRASLTPEKIKAAQNGPTIVTFPTHQDVSEPLIDLMKRQKRLRKEDGPLQEDHLEDLVEVPEAAPFSAGELVESFLQTNTPLPSAFIAGTNFEGPGEGIAGFSVNTAPPDTTLAVGPNHVVAWVNSQFMIFNKAGVAQLPAPGYANGNTIWNGFGGVCETTNRGDPLVQYDRLADRWVFSQFAFDKNANGDNIAPFLQCFAISTGPDPAGPYNRYSYTFADFNDYGKIGIWNDGYYVGYNMFASGTNNGAGLCAYDRTKMLAGQAATSLCAPTTFYAGGGSIFPADMDGTSLPTDLTRGGLFLSRFFRLGI